MYHYTLTQSNLSTTQEEFSAHSNVFPTPIFEARGFRATTGLLPCLQLSGCHSCRVSPFLPPQNKGILNLHSHLGLADATAHIFLRIHSF